MKGLDTQRPARAGVVAVVVGVAILAAAVIGPKVFLSVRADTFHAQVANATGLQPGDPVHVAGVPSGVVEGLAVSGSTVDVSFRLDKGVTMGDQSTVAITILTVLGRRSLDVTPAGQHPAEASSTIPIERTTVPFTIDDLGRNAQDTTNKLDIDQLRSSIAAISQATPQDPAMIGQALTGIGQVTDIINRNSDTIGQVLTAAQATTQTLVAEKDTLVTLLGNADLVLQTLNDRRAAIASLITDVDDLTTTAQRFLSDNQGLVDSVLTKLHAVTGVLTDNRSALDELLKNFAPAARYVTNATGNGNFIDILGPAGLIPDSVVCSVGLVRGCQ